MLVYFLFQDLFSCTNVDTSYSKLMFYIFVFVIKKSYHQFETIFYAHLTLYLLHFSIVEYLAFILHLILNVSIIN